MSEAIFLRLQADEDKPIALAKAILSAQEGKIQNSIYIVDAKSFSQVPDSTFAYWVSECVRHIFNELPAFESEGRTVKQGLVTADDFRFVRLWWEVRSENSVSGRQETQPEQFRQQTFSGKLWVPFAKGGSYSPYYSDLLLVVNWERDGEAIRDFIDPITKRPYSRRQNMSFYFQPGLTWPSRPHKRGAFSHVPVGAIFSHTGTMLFLPEQSHWSTCALLNSDAYIGLLHLLMARGGAQSGQTLKYEIGYIASVPIPHFDEDASQKLSQLVVQSYNLYRTLSTANEVDHLFYLPALLQINGMTLAARISLWQSRLNEIRQIAIECQCKVNDIAFRLYDIDGEDRRALEETLEGSKQIVEDEDAVLENEDDMTEDSTDKGNFVADTLSYLTGCAFGRWDMRFALIERAKPELPDPFAPLPICSPGMLTKDGLPLQKLPSSYPLQISLEGILVDDADNPDDIVRRVQEVFRVIWHENAEAIEQEACQLLGVKELREYFRRSGNDGFWMDHVKRYSKSRRKAPIYWLLQSSKRNYALWLYYHRLDSDMLFKALTHYVEPKIRLEEGRLKQIRTQLASFGTAGREVKQLERQLDRQENLLAELYDFRDKLRCVADLHLEPDLNDGVVLNIASLWELVPWSEAKKYWEELLAGKYEWSSISKQLLAKGAI